MTAWTLIRRSLQFHARAHVGTFLGVAVGSGILTGALLVGDSVRESLRVLALARLGSIEVALAGGDRFVRSALAQELGGRLGGVVAPAIQLDATAATPDESARANGVQLLGVDERFWRLTAGSSSFPSPASDEVLLNERLADQLRVAPGGTVVLRASRPSALSRETPLSPQEDSELTLRLTVAGIVPEANLGPFSLRPSQVPPMNAFVHLGTLQERLDMGGRANLLLASGETITASAANEALGEAWQPADAELELRLLADRPVVELRTPRVFLEPAAVSAAMGLDSRAHPILTYFVNELIGAESSTPYSMVAAAGPPLTPEDLGDDEIVVNSWLADDLKVEAGSELELRYYVLSTGRRLEERGAKFKVRSVVPLEGAAADRDLMPEFPGIEKADSTRDWDPTLPVSMGKIRDQDEKYWEDYRGTPKAFISLAAGQALWTNRFGELTAIRFPVNAASAAADRDALEGKLRSALRPAQFGLQFESVREQALSSADQSQDFGGLFLGFSVFLIVAALLLVGLLFQFGVERRAEEIGTLLAVGFRPRRVRGFLLGEAFGLAILGSVAGAACGTVYARMMIHGLATLWRDAVGTTALAYYGSVTSLVTGGVAGAVVAVLAIALALRKQARRPARELLAGPSEEGAAEFEGAATGRSWRRMVAIGGAVLGLVLVIQALARGESASPGIFFGAGALWLIAGLAAVGLILQRLNRRESSRDLSVVSLGIRNTSRRRGRSVAVVGLLAGGSFLIASIGVFRLDAVRDAGKRSSGTGGFALVGETTFPVVQDLNTPEGLEFYALDPADLPGVSFVVFRVRDGDDASCLNLNRARQPRLLGVDSQELERRGSFSFAKAAKGFDRDQGWGLLQMQLTSPDGVPEVPAVGDLNSILWAMGRKVGDTLDYQDERGRAFRVRLVGAVANSILQGSLLIEETAFLKLFPSEPGYRMFLVDAPAGEAENVGAVLTRALRTAGLESTDTVDRLNAFNAVQNTYLGTFQMLGGLGLLLGSIGLGILVLRNVLERRGELALLLAVGFRSRAVRRMVIAEHAGLLVGGLILGMISAAVAVLPNLLSPTAQVPYVALTLTLAGVMASGLLWTWLAAAVALRGRLLDGLRNE